MFPTRRLLLGLIPACVRAVPGAPNSLTADEKSVGWTLLFDGSSATGWRDVSGDPFPVAAWTVEDGCLRALDPGTGLRDIRTEATFASFDFCFEWKVPPGGNSGVKYLVQRVDQWTNRQGPQSRARGLEYQIVDNSSKDAREPSLTAAALYHAIAPSKQMAKPPGAFNDARIVVRGTRVEHWLNGAKVVAFETTDPAAWKNVDTQGALPVPARETFLALQNHGTSVWFRNLKIRRLPD